MRNHPQGWCRLTARAPSVDRVRPLLPFRHPVPRLAPDRLAAVVVAVPARDEETLLGDCLASVAVASARLRLRRPRLRTVVVVALDGCTDGSADVASAYGALTVHLGGAGVGRARDAAIAAGLSAVAPSAEARVWIACTDADTVVSPAWLHRQVRLAECGVDLVVGTVEPFGVESAQVLSGWYARHSLTEGHEHVHGANLGVRASHWRGHGGFGPATVGEDVGLVERIRGSGRATCLATDTTRVRTSGRLVSRVDGGFATYLRATEPAPTAVAPVDESAASVLGAAPALGGGA